MSPFARLEIAQPNAVDAHATEPHDFMRKRFGDLPEVMVFALRDGHSVPRVLLRVVKAS